MYIYVSFMIKINCSFETDSTDIALCNIKIFLFCQIVIVKDIC